MSSHSFRLGKEVIKQIEDAHFQAYFVGGCVRDLLLNRPIRDIDIATSAKPNDIMQIFNKVIPIGIEHGTVLVRYQKQSFEITTFRTDGDYSDQRHPDSVDYIEEIDGDLKRRDFTMNALAMDRKGEIIDLFHGEQHIQQELIQTVGSPYDRFMEDSLRIIRALRFSSQLGFDIHEDTLTQMKRVKSEVEQVAVERIRDEMSKFFAGQFIHIGIDYLIETEIYQHLPMFSMKLLSKKPIPLHSFSEVIALFHILQPEQSISQLIKAWKCSNKTKNDAIELVKAIQYDQQYGLDELLVFDLPNDLYDGFIRVVHYAFNEQIDKNQLLKIEAQLPIQSLSELQISGADLIQLFPNRKQGPWIQTMLNEIKNQVLLSSLDNHKSKLKEWAKCYPPETK